MEMTMEISRKDRLEALDRKKALGLAASYAKISKRIGRSRATIQAVLRDGPREVPTNRARVLKEVNRALDDIETELREQDGPEA